MKKTRDPATLPSIERIRELFYLEGRSVRRRVARNQFKAGDVAGGHDAGSGYRRVAVDGVQVWAHRLAFAIHHGRWPSKFIDHIDGDRTNNDPANLREVTSGENMQNRIVASRSSKTGLLGVSQVTHGLWKGRFRYTIMVGGKQTGKSNFPTAEAAHAAYLEKKRELHPFAREIAVVTNVAEALAAVGIEAA